MIWYFLRPIVHFLAMQGLEIISERMVASGGFRSRRWRYEDR